MSIFHRKAKVASVPSGAGPGAVATCQHCGHKHAVTITAGRAQGGTFAMCPKCSKGGFYDEYGQPFSPAQQAATDLFRKYGQNT